MRKWRTTLLAVCVFSLVSLLLWINYPYLYTLDLLQTSRLFTDSKHYFRSLMMMDISRLQSEQVSRVVNVKTTADIQHAVQEAKAQQLRISMAGAKHSQGGHTFAPKAIVLNMKGYNQILSLDKKSKVIRVQSGATWEDIQQYLQPHQLAVSVMQSSNIFTVGGSLSANVHGRDPRYGPLIETVESFHLLLADGTIKHVSRTENDELFRLVIGGFGLFGVILDVDLKVVDDQLYEAKTTKVHYKQFTEYYKNNVLQQPVQLAIGRLSIDPHHLLDEMYVTTYQPTTITPDKDVYTLQEEQHVERNKFFISLARDFDWGKSLFWRLQQQYAPKQQIISRNNAMRPEIKFLDYYSEKNTDILQEYFVPTDQYAAFIDELRKIVRTNEANLINVTVRYIRKNEEAYLSYAKNDGFAIVVLFNQALTTEGKRNMEITTQQIIDASIRHNGTYYLIYQLYPSSKQLQTVYPKVGDFFAKKLHYDPELLFMNMFYKKYAGGSSDG